MHFQACGRGVRPCAHAAAWAGSADKLAAPAGNVKLMQQLNATGHLADYFVYDYGHLELVMATNVGDVMGGRLLMLLEKLRGGYVRRPAVGKQ